ncbi:MAG: choice-of-anchor A family protein [Pseudomonadota bacterium]|nr:choice-of-anchor A family protein [Pseudomonadota bacterium]
MTTFKTGLLLISLLAAHGSQAGVIDLTGAIGGANLYAIHDFTAPSSDVEGALLAGGNVKLSSYSVNALNKDAFGTNGYALVAGGNLTLTGGSINNGLAYVGGTTTLTYAAAAPTSRTSPIDFNAAAAYYNTLSTTLSRVGATGSVAALYSGVKLTGSGNGKVDVFNVSESMFRNSSSWTLDKLTAGETLIFNVSGNSVTFNEGGISFEPLAGYNVLFNFYEATSVNVKGVIGSVLAPKAAVTADWGVINGTVIVDRWASTIQVNANHYFVATELAGFNDGQHASSPNKVPEPGSLALLLGGLGAAALVRRRNYKPAA